VVIAHIVVMCVIKPSLIRVTLQSINIYIVVSAHIAVMCVIRHSL